MSYIKRSPNQAFDRARAQKDRFANLERRLIRIRTEPKFAIVPCIKGKGKPATVKAETATEAAQIHFGDKISKIFQSNGHLSVTLTDGIKFSVRRWVQQ